MTALLPIRYQVDALLAYLVAPLIYQVCDNLLYQIVEDEASGVVDGD